MVKVQAGGVELGSNAVVDEDFQAKGHLTLLILPNRAEAVFPEPAHRRGHSCAGPHRTT